jgi:hypothetical protein
MLLCASSPHARKGALWGAYSKHFGNDNDQVLVWQASTRDMNASVRQSYIDMHVAEDPARAAAEYGAQFRTDIKSFILREAAQACVSPGVRELSPQPNIGYQGFCDPSGGSADSMTLAIGKQTVVIDALREVKPPFSPEVVVGEFSKLLIGLPVGAQDDVPILVLLEHPTQLPRSIGSDDVVDVLERRPDPVGGGLRERGHMHPDEIHYASQFRLHRLALRVRTSF